MRAIVRMAESLDLTLVAEGVEDAATLAVLRDMGAAQAQGYFFDKPLPLEHSCAHARAAHDDGKRGAISRL